ncbi:MAG: hypothetical protein RR482_09875 [Clostridia bacterium]
MKSNQNALWKALLYTLVFFWVAVCMGFVLLRMTAPENHPYMLPWIENR